MLPRMRGETRPRCRKDDSDPPTLATILCRRTGKNTRFIRTRGRRIPALGGEARSGLAGSESDRRLSMRRARSKRPPFRRPTPEWALTRRPSKRTDRLGSDWSGADARRQAPDFTRGYVSDSQEAQANGNAPFARRRVFDYRCKLAFYAAARSAIAFLRGHGCVRHDDRLRAIKQLRAISAVADMNAARIGHVQIRARRNFRISSDILSGGFA